MCVCCVSRGQARDRSSGGASSAEGGGQSPAQRCSHLLPRQTQQERQAVPHDGETRPPLFNVVVVGVGVLTDC